VPAVPRRRGGPAARGAARAALDRRSSNANGSTLLAAMATARHKRRHSPPPRGAAAQRGTVATLWRAGGCTIHTHKIQPSSFSTLANVAASSVPGLAKSLLSIPAASRSAA